jgi:hypothetical protein
LSDKSHYSHRELVRVGHVGGNERNASLLQAEQEMRVPGQTVELSNQ